MANDQISYPMIPLKTWWELRKKFIQSIPGVVTAGYLAASLDMKEVSARANVLPYLVQLGIVDDEGRTVDRARQWRDDTQYPDVCREMREDVYPRELLDAVPNPSENVYPRELLDAGQRKRATCCATQGRETKKERYFFNETDKGVKKRVSSNACG